MRIAAGIEYDGAGYAGWQYQSHSPSVQEQVQIALGRVANEPVTVHCAGRTDTGVHALQQVIHFDTEAVRSERSWLLGANSNLPDDVAIQWARQVDADFHARFSATARRYRYIILNRPTRSAVLSGKVVVIRPPLDAGAMNQAAQALVGEHDFSSFRAQGCQARHPNRCVLAISVSRRDDFVYLDIAANAFLHHMVRNIAGALIEVGKGERAPEWIAELLALRDRKQGGVTAPPGGLYLVGVDYPERFGLPVPPSPIGFTGQKS